MNLNMEELISKFKYEMSNQEKMNLIGEVSDVETLYLLMFNYNWDDGFEIPNIALKNECCDLSVALMIFSLSGGYDYLFDKEEFEDDGDEWFSFINMLYGNIVNEVYKRGDIYFDPPLTKLEKFKLKKILNDNELIFIETFGEKKLADLDIE